MSKRSAIQKVWQQQAMRAGIAPDLAELGTRMLRTLYEQSSKGESIREPHLLPDSGEATIRFAVEQPQQARELWTEILDAQQRGEWKGTFGGYDVHELLEYAPGDYPWDRWEKRALATGVANRLAALGRSLMREAVQHNWDADLQGECGWADEGLTLLRYVLQEPEQACRRWEYLLKTDGDRFFDA